MPPTSSVDDFLEKARAMRPNDAQLAKVQASYGEIIGRVNRITPLYGLLELWQFRETGRNWIGFWPVVGRPRARSDE